MDATAVESPVGMAGEGIQMTADTGIEELMQLMAITGDGLTSEEVVNEWSESIVEIEKQRKCLNSETIEVLDRMTANYQRIRGLYTALKRIKRSKTDFENQLQSNRKQVVSLSVDIEELIRNDHKMGESVNRFEKATIDYSKALEEREALFEKYRSMHRNLVLDLKLIRNLKLMPLNTKPGFKKQKKCLESDNRFMKIDLEVEKQAIEEMRTSKQIMSSQLAFLKDLKFKSERQLHEMLDRLKDLQKCFAETNEKLVNLKQKDEKFRKLLFESNVYLFEDKDKYKKLFDVWIQLKNRTKALVLTKCLAKQSPIDAVERDVILKD